MTEFNFQRTHKDRFDEGYYGIEIHNESNKLPGHEERMKEHEKRVQKERMKMRIIEWRNSIKNA